MIINGHIANGTVIIDSSIEALPEGTLVEITPLIESADPFCGCWEDDRSAENIIADIKGSRINRRTSLGL